MNLVPINTNTNTNTNPFENISSNENYSETEYFFHSNNINESQENIAINEIEIKLQNNIIDNNHIIDFSNEFVQKLYNDFLMEINDTYNNEDSCIICLDVFDKNNEIGLDRFLYNHSNILIDDSSDDTEPCKKNITKSQLLGILTQIEIPWHEIDEIKK